jgi:hypothetical protein
MVEDFHKQPTTPGLSHEISSSLPLPTPDIPKTIGPYKIESLLEKGGMSVLYLATHPETKEPTTIKVLSPKYATDPDVIRRFTNEADIIAMANHPNIVQLYGSGTWEGGLYIAMEFIQGISLRQYILKTPVSLTRAIDIIIDIAYALCHLHSHGVIHRDLKPENIIITESGKIKVIDFGIAQLLAKPDTAQLNARRQLLGTPVYMSKEQRENPDTVSYPSDIYALGIIAYELILGKLSHGQIHISLMPKGIQKILHKALQPNPEDRYQDAVDFIADISEYKSSTALQKEKKPSDTISELAESLKRAQLTLLTNNPPLWPEVEIGLAGQHGINISGIYYDFFEFPDGKYAIIMGESSSKGSEAVIYTAVLRGIVRGLCRMAPKPLELIAQLNDILVKDSMKQMFTLNYLVVDPKANELHYISCGHGSLWLIKAGEADPIKISMDNQALGSALDTQFVETTQPWHIGDTLVLNTFTTPHASLPAEFSEGLFEQALQDNANRSPKKQVEGILRKVSATANKLLHERSIFLVSILRKKL